MPKPVALPPVALPKPVAYLLKGHLFLPGGLTAGQKIKAVPLYAGAPRYENAEWTIVPTSPRGGKRRLAGRAQFATQTRGLWRARVVNFAVGSRPFPDSSVGRATDC
jgi:hypothetical protein